MAAGFIFSGDLTNLARQQASNTAKTMDDAQHLRLVVKLEDPLIIEMAITE